METQRGKKEREIVNEHFLLGSFTMPVILQPIKFKSKADGRTDRHFRMNEQILYGYDTVKGNSF